VHSGPRPGRWWLGRYDYPTKFRVFEVASLVCFAVFGSVFAARTSGAVLDRLEVEVAVGVGLAALGAFLLADFLSGLVHFLCDNLGSPATPVLGQKFIKAFREHHDDPVDMTRGDFVEVNADNFFVCLPVLVPCVLWLDVTRHVYLATFLVVLMAFVTVTNEVHKWAHMPEVPRAMRALQRTPLVLAPADHGVHHTAPYDSAYCITSGVLNPVLSSIRFWPALLRVLRRSSTKSGSSSAAGTGRPST
jgi:hypothetical protein